MFENSFLTSARPTLHDICARFSLNSPQYRALWVCVFYLAQISHIMPFWVYCAFQGISCPFGYIMPFWVYHALQGISCLSGYIMPFWVYHALQGTNCDAYPKGYDVSYPLGTSARKQFSNTFWYRPLSGGIRAMLVYSGG